MHNKYQKLKKQYSTDGVNWYDVTPPEYKEGVMLEENSPDCGGTPTIYRWYVKEDEYVCEGYNKYEKLVYQQSTNNGITWVDVVPEQTATGSLIESNSIDCDYGITWEIVDGQYICNDDFEVMYRWYTLPDDFECDGYDKYEKQVYQVSNDGGWSWQNVVPSQVRKGSLIETDSEDCGFEIWKEVDGYICDVANKDNIYNYLYEYARFTRLQRFHKDGTAYIPEEYKIGKLLSNVLYDNINACEWNVELNEGTEPLNYGRVLYYNKNNGNLEIDVPYVNNNLLPIGVSLDLDNTNIYGDNSISFLSLNCIQAHVWVQNKNYEGKITPSVNESTRIPITNKTTDRFNYKIIDTTQSPYNIIDWVEFGTDTFTPSYGEPEMEYDTVNYDNINDGFDFDFENQNTFNPIMENTIFSTICGKENTQKLYDSSIYNISDTGYPDINVYGSLAAYKALNFVCEGTDKGDWYIPSIYENTLYVKNKDRIKNIINYLVENYFVAHHFEEDITSLIFAYLVSKEIREPMVDIATKEQVLSYLNISLEYAAFANVPHFHTIVGDESGTLVLIKVSSNGTIIK